MSPTIIVGATGAGKTTALMRRYYEWVRGGARTDQILVLTAGAKHSSGWRRGLQLETHGPIEAHSFFGFIQRELQLFWAPVQHAIPELTPWVRPEFLNVEIAHHLMRGLLEPLAGEFAGLRASPQRLSIQIASNLATVGASAGLSPGEIARRLAQADSAKERAPLYDHVQGLMEGLRETCLRAGLLDYSLSLHLFTGVLLHHPDYLAHLRGRYRYLLVDDLDETVPAEHDFLERLAEGMEGAVFAFNPDGGHAGFMGADPMAAWERFISGNRDRIDLDGSYTCSAENFRFGAALAHQVRRERPEVRFPDAIEERIATDLRGDMIEAVVQKVIALAERGIPAGEIAIISPHVDKALEVTIRRTLASRGIPVQNLSLSRRLVDEPDARAIITLAALVHPQWGIPVDTAGSISAAMQLLLQLDPIRASILGDAIWRGNGALPDLDETGLRRRIGFERSEAYEFLRRWIEEARQKEWETDAFAQAVVAEVMAPLVGTRLTPERLHATQQLLVSASRFHQAMERFGEGSMGREYVKMLTEGTVAAEPLEAYDPQKDAVTLATPFAYLNARLVSQVQIWFDISGNGWYPNDVKELANPHVLTRRWDEGDRWSTNRSNKERQRNAARTVQALVRRCRGRLVLAECALTPWGQEQESGLSEVFSELTREVAP